jgi:hypothetical protein
MPASKLNYIVVYDNHSQVYGSSSDKIAIESAPPDGLSEKDKHIFFITFEPDTKNICIHKVDPNNREEIDNKSNKRKKKDSEQKD